MKHESSLYLGFSSLLLRLRLSRSPVVVEQSVSICKAYKSKDIKNRISHLERIKIVLRVRVGDDQRRD